jgi:hypothetical protein
MAISPESNVNLVSWCNPAKHPMRQDLVSAVHVQSLGPRIKNGVRCGPTELLGYSFSGKSSNNEDISRCNASGASAE